MTNYPIVIMQMLHFDANMYVPLRNTNICTVCICIEEYASCVEAAFSLLTTRGLLWSILMRFIL